MQKQPYVSPQLIHYLKEQFPLDEFNRKSTLEDFKFYQGTQSIIEHLEMLQKKQEKENILNVPLQQEK